MIHKNNLYYAILGSFFLSEEKKEKLVQLLPSLSEAKIKRLQKIFQNEKELVSNALLERFQKPDGKDVFKKFLGGLQQIKKNFLKKQEQYSQKIEEAFLKKLENDLLGS
jgi:endonuclease III-like uncharacterized protein